MHLVHTRKHSLYVSMVYIYPYTSCIISMYITQRRVSRIIYPDTYALFHAANIDNANAFKTLIRLGTDVNTLYNDAPLIVHAIWWKWQYGANILLAAGADTSCLRAFPRCIYLIGRRYSMHSISMVSNNCSTGQYDLHTGLLHFACVYGRIRLVRFLLKHGCDVHSMRHCVRGSHTVRREIDKWNK